MHITLDWMMWQFGRPHGVIQRRHGRRGKYCVDEYCLFPDDRLKEIAKQEAEQEFTEELKAVPLINNEVEREKKQLLLDKQISELRTEIYLDMKKMIEEMNNEEDDIKALMMLV